MRPQTPNINMEMRRPTSPPETPPTGSPGLSRSKGPNGRASPSYKGVGPFNPPEALSGVGSGFPGSLHPEAISPMESTEDDEESDANDSDASDASDSPPHSPASYVHRDETSSSIPEHVTTTTIEIEEVEVEIEDIFTVVEQDEDDMESDDCDDGNPPLQPDSIEDPDSSRSTSPSSLDRGVPEDMLSGMANVSCGDDSDFSDSEYGRDELIQHLRHMREQRRQRRMTMGSFSKRTVSERDSDEDREDLQPYDMGDNNQRRIRRKLNLNRLSLISNPRDIIIELAEPTSDDQMSGDDADADGDGLFQFWRLMEVDDAE